MQTSYRILHKVLSDMTRRRERDEDEECIQNFS
jgi:hypothetical protein